VNATTSRRSTRAPADPHLQVVLDEVTRRSRQEGQHSIESARLWPETAAHKVFLAGQRRLGDGLRRDLLPEVLGGNDGAAVGASPVRIFGNRGQRFRLRVPYVLAHGHECGSGLCALVGGTPEAAAEAGRLCAVFNFAVALFDTICDDYPALFEEVTSAFDEPVLRAVLAGDRTSIQAFERRAGEARAIEVRLVLKSLAWFLLRVRTLPGAAGTHETLSTSLVDALRAELRSVAVDAGTERDLVDASRAKSVLPLTVVRDVVLLAAAPRDRQAVAVLDQLVSAVGASFWLMDDLIDAASDLRTGALNSVLARAGSTPTRSPDATRGHAVAARLLASDVLDRAGADVLATINQAVTTLQSPVFAAGPAARLREAFSSFMRSAVE
jgi:hypothetical protein